MFRRSECHNNSSGQRREPGRKSRKLGGSRGALDFTVLIWFHGSVLRCIYIDPCNHSSQSWKSYYYPITCVHHWIRIHRNSYSIEGMARRTSHVYLRPPRSGLFTAPRNCRELEPRGAGYTKYPQQIDTTNIRGVQDIYVMILLWCFYENSMIIILYRSISICLSVPAVPSVPCVSHLSMQTALASRPCPIWSTSFWWPGPHRAARAGSWASFSLSIRPWKRKATQRQATHW